MKILWRRRLCLGGLCVLAGLLTVLGQGNAADADGGYRDPVDPAGLRWRYSVLGDVVAQNGLEAVDVDGDGRTEIIVTSWEEGAYFTVLEWRDGEYRPKWASPVLPPPAGTDTWSIGSLRAVNLDADAALEIVVGMGPALGHSRIFVFDGATHRIERSFDASQEGVFNLEIADVDGDGALELLFTATDARDHAPQGSALQILDAATGADDGSTTDLSIVSVAVGDIDQDRQPEIVAARRSDLPCLILNGRTRAVEATIAGDGFSLPRVGDVDGDGQDEIVLVADGVVQVLEGRTRAVRWSHVLGLKVSALRLLDVRRSSTPEVLYGDEQSRVHALDGLSGREFWSAGARTNAADSVLDIVAGDLDNDGVQEIAWSAGWYNLSMVYLHSAQAYLHVADALTGTEEWLSQGPYGPFPGIAHGDVDADGDPEIVAASLGRGGFDWQWHVFDARSGEIKSVGPDARPSVQGPQGLLALNVDSDPQLEILVAASSVLEGGVVCYDSLTHELQWVFAPDDGRFTALAAADVDADGAPEILARGGLDLYVLNAAQGTVEWTARAGGSGFLRHLVVGDIEGDATPEIVVAYDEPWTTAGELVVVDTTTHAVVRLALGFPIGTIALVDLDGDDTPEILVGRPDGRIVHVSPTTGETLATVADLGRQITAITDASGLYAAGGAALVVLTRTDVRVVSPVDGTLLWSGEPITAPGSYDPLPPDAGWGEGLVVADVDDDGTTEIVVNTGRGIDVFDVQPRFVAEGAATVAEGAGQALFTVRLREPHGAPLTVDFATEDGTAAAGDDYVAAAGTLTFAAGEVEKIVAVTLLDDHADEDEQTFSFRLSNASVGRVPAPVIVTILDDDPPPTLMLPDQAPAEGDTPWTLSLAVHLSAPSVYPITVGYRTQDGTARAGSDYARTTGTLVFAPGVTSATISLPVLGDRRIEPDETLSLVLGPTRNATLSSPSVKVTLRNDDTSALSIGNVLVREGGSALFPLRLSRPCPQAVTAEWRAVDGTATAADGDYVPGRGLATFPPGSVSTTVAVRVNRDGRVEPAETFSVQLARPTGGGILAGVGLGTATIRD